MTTIQTGKKIHLVPRETGVSRHYGAQLRAPLEPLSTIVLCHVRGFQRGAEFVPHDAERRQSLSENYTSDRCCFSSLGLHTSDQLILNFSSPTMENII